MRPVIIIPARFDSSRFPGKPLALINGKPLILHVLESANVLGWRTLVATDDMGIAMVVREAGGEAVMTGMWCRNGTERVAAAADFLELPDNVLVFNWQGDAPLTDPAWVDQLRHYMMARDSCLVGTIGVETEEFAKGAVRVQRADDMVFSFTRSQGSSGARGLHHVGLYAYRRPALRFYPLLQPTMEEEISNLEQLRWPQRLGLCMIRNADAGRLREVNYPDDIQAVSDMLSARHGRALPIA